MSLEAGDRGDRCEKAGTGMLSPAKTGIVTVSFSAGGEAAG